MKIVKRIQSGYAKIEKWFNCVPATLTRATLGVLFVQSGWAKIHDLQKVTDYFVSLHIMFPSFNAHMVSLTELTCGSLLLLGLATRLAAFPLMISMTVALITAKTADVSSFSDLADVSEYLYIILLIWLFVKGAGPISVDYLIKKKFEHFNRRY